MVLIKCHMNRDWKPRDFTHCSEDKKALLSQRWLRDAPYVYLQAIHPNFVHAYGHYTMRGFW